MSLPAATGWNEEMEKRSRRRIRDLVARPASLGLSENETGCARISTTVWTGRALQAESDDLEVIGLALLFRPLNGTFVFLAIMCQQRSSGWSLDHLPRLGACNIAERALWNVSRV
jgi:hypothetical protein